MREIPRGGDAIRVNVFTRTATFLPLEHDTGPVPARVVKHDRRFRSMLAGANDLVFTRMYRSFGEIWNGFSKNLYLGVRERPWQLPLALVMLAAISPLPEFALLRAIKRRDYRTIAAMAVDIAATAAAAEFGMLRSRFPKGSGLFFPVGAAAMLAIFVNSAIAHRTGKVHLRGRNIPTPPKPL